MAALASQKGILPVRGLEWTTYHGHMVVLEENGYTDWRGVKPEEIDEAYSLMQKYRQTYEEEIRSGERKEKDLDDLFFYIWE